MASSMRRSLPLVVLILGVMVVSSLAKETPEPGQAPCPTGFVWRPLDSAPSPEEGIEGHGLRGNRHSAGSKAGAIAPFPSKVYSHCVREVVHPRSAEDGNAPAKAPWLGGDKHNHGNLPVDWGHGHKDGRYAPAEAPSEDGHGKPSDGKLLVDPIYRHKDGVDSPAEAPSNEGDDEPFTKLLFQKPLAVEDAPAQAPEEDKHDNHERESHGFAGAPREGNRGHRQAFAGASKEGKADYPPGKSLGHHEFVGAPQQGRNGRYWGNHPVFHTFAGAPLGSHVFPPWSRKSATDGDWQTWGNGHLSDKKP